MIDYRISVMKDPKGGPTAGKPWRLEMVDLSRPEIPFIRTWHRTKTEANLRVREAMMIIGRCGKTAEVQGVSPA